MSDIDDSRLVDGTGSHTLDALERSADNANYIVNESTIVQPEEYTWGGYGDCCWIRVGLPLNCYCLCLGQLGRYIV